MVPAVVVTSAFAIGLIAHALFIRAPIDRSEDLTDEVERIGPVEIAD